jgi:uncharacterized protein (TIGR02391 family)
MADLFRQFERLARNASRLSEAEPREFEGHPFELRNIHAALPAVVKRLFDNGHYAQATFEAFKYIDNEVKRHSGLRRIGKALMLEALKEAAPLIKLNGLISESDLNEQEGYKFIFAGSVIAIRNPRGHDDIVDDVDTCLDHLSLASHLLRRLEQAGYKPKRRKVV